MGYVDTVYVIVLSVLCAYSVRLVVKRARLVRSLGSGTPSAGRPRAGGPAPSPSPDLPPRGSTPDSAPGGQVASP